MSADRAISCVPVSAVSPAKAVVSDTLRSKQSAPLSPLPVAHSRVRGEGEEQQRVRMMHCWRLWWGRKERKRSGPKNKPAELEYRNRKSVSDVLRQERWVAQRSQVAAGHLRSADALVSLEMPMDCEVPREYTMIFFATVRLIAASVQRFILTVGRDRMFANWRSCDDQIGIV